ncbi:hypothetical protein D9M71_716540 [compost metagenome]
MTDIKLKTIKGFEWRGSYARPGSDIAASELDARELLRNGLIEDYNVKAAEAPDNKMDQEPNNKAAAKPKNQQHKPKAD